MNKRKLTEVMMVLTLGITLLGSSVTASAKEKYFDFSNKTYYEESLYDKYQWDIKRITNNGASFYLESGNHSVVVGVVDTGIDVNHPDLKENILGGKNLVPAGFNGDETETGDINDIQDRVGHGTQVAGAIAANGRIKGVAPNIGIKCYRTATKNQDNSVEIIANAVKAAVDDGVDVINISIGCYLFEDGMYFINPKTKEEVKVNESFEEYKLFKEAIEYADKHNVVVVTCASNEHLDCSSPEKLTEELNNKNKSSNIFIKGKSYAVPGVFSNTITVSSTKMNDALSSFSNYGQGYVTVAAPGGEYFISEGEIKLEEGCIVASMINHGYEFSGGTSLSAPKVSAEAALILCKNKNLTPKEVKKKIMDTADKAGDEAYYGAGIINVYNALK